MNPIAPKHERRRGIHTPAALAGAVPTPYDWGPWRLDPSHLTLTHDASTYEIDLETCTSSAQVLDWVMQINTKTWGDNATIAGLVRAFDDLLHPQANLCSSGQSRQLSRTSIRSSVTQQVRRAALPLIDYTPRAGDTP